MLIVCFCLHPIISLQCVGASETKQVNFNLLSTMRFPKENWQAMCNKKIKKQRKHYACIHINTWTSSNTEAKQAVTKNAMIKAKHREKKVTERKVKNAPST